MARQTIPVFVFAAEAIEALDSDTKAIADYDARYVVAPFEDFILRARPHAIVRTGVGSLKFDRSFREVRVNCVKPGRFVVTENLGAGPQEITVSVDDATVQWTATCVHGNRILTEGQSIWPLTADRDAAAAGRIVIGCLLALNHRKVEIREGPPPTRQERRDAERHNRAPQIEREVIVGRNIVSYAGDVARGKHSKQREAHLVRSHVRHYRSGLVTHVKAHQRGTGTATAAPIYNATAIGGSR